ncbi:MAG: amidohydrolase family protein [Candidatus Eisenbacteria bacterium]|uniref:Amidohydrolase family protein n=1 Tax=Eiseniibacteriota bacterium TaxID=2212470 RepID=A0A948RZH4_UNCEI|nr:amidohydrolase family protein [Candidatus Eisenbacteria bacterium]MBU1951155.1 amidohydrolase family protein [Candidatus Eisenbacteria bacterium]MBU2692503.1 amidohydrolase family protein [Candidatus Eisenbacteria bacterium]
MNQSLKGITDIHIHVQPWDQLRPEVKEIVCRGRKDAVFIEGVIADPHLLISEMDRLGVQRVGLMNFASSVIGSGEEINDWTVNYIRGYESRLVAFGCPDLQNCRDIGRRIRDLADRGLRGLKIHPPHQGMAPNAYLEEPGHPLAVLYETAQHLKLPVAFHTGTSSFPGARSRLGHPMLIDDVAIDFPELTILLAHSGRPLWYDEAVFLARRHSHLYLDLSSIPARRIPEILPRLEMIADKVLYGSDWPGPGVPSLQECLTDFIELDIPLEVKTKILIENGNRLLGEPFI